MISYTRRKCESGVATLLVAVILLMSATVLTLSVARTLLDERRMINQDGWHTRLSYQAEAALAEAVVSLADPQQPLAWSGANAQHARRQLPVTGADIDREVVFTRADAEDRFVEMEATAWRDSDTGASAVAAQTVRPLSIISPLAERAPPLVVNGCTTGNAHSLHLRPEGADSDRAGDAAWLAPGCNAPAGADLHEGHIRDDITTSDLWHLTFTLNREAYTELARAQETLPSGQRLYWLAGPGTLRESAWALSIGTPTRPVVLYFPEQAGCPRFAGDVHIYGLVFIDASCSTPIEAPHLNVHGALLVNGTLNVDRGAMDLGHIQLADATQTRLHFPVLRAVPVPGSWRDF